MSCSMWCITHFYIYRQVPVPTFLREDSLTNRHIPRASREGPKSGGEQVSYSVVQKSPTGCLPFKHDYTWDERDVVERNENANIGEGMSLLFRAGKLECKLVQIIQLLPYTKHCITKLRET